MTSKEEETELKELNRTLKNIRTTRNNYSLGTGLHAEHIQRQINVELKIQTNVKKNFKLTVSNQNLVRDSKNCVKIEKALLNKSLILSHIDRTKTEHQNLELDIKRWENKVRQQRIETSNDRFKKCSFLSSHAYMKRLSVLEGRLNREESKFGNLLAKNGLLRDLIRTLINEKHKFISRNIKLTERHHETVENLRSIVDVALSIIDQTKELKERKEAFIEKNDIKIQLLNTDIQDLAIFVDQKINLRIFMMNKSETRAEQMKLKYKRDLERLSRENVARQNKLETLTNAAKRIAELILVQDYSDSSNLMNDMKLVVKKSKIMGAEQHSGFLQVNYQKNTLDRLMAALEETEEDTARQININSGIVYKLEEELKIKTNTLDELNNDCMIFTKQQDKFSHIIIKLNQIINNLYTKLTNSKPPKNVLKSISKIEHLTDNIILASHYCDVNGAKNWVQFSTRGNWNVQKATRARGLASIPRPISKIDFEKITQNKNTKVYLEQTHDSHEHDEKNKISDFLNQNTEGEDEGEFKLANMVTDCYPMSLKELKGIAYRHYRYRMQKLLEMRGKKNWNKLKMRKISLARRGALLNSM